MTHRATVAVAALALSLAAFAVTRPAPAEGTSKNFFSMLKVGQMVELAFEPDSNGYYIRIYDDPAKKGLMAFKVTDLQDEYITLHLDPSPNPAEIWDVRLPAQSVVAMFHVRLAKKK